MAAAGVSGGVDEVLRARANARRIKEHYEGTLGVPSELQSLSHLLAHDRDAVFTGLENLPCYNKSSIPAPPAPPAPEPPPPPQPVSRRRTHCLPAHGATVRTSFDVAPSSMAAPTLMPPAPLELDPCDPDPDSHSAVQTPQAELHQNQQQQPLPTIPSLDEQPPEYPPEPGAGFHSPGRVRLPSGLSVDPWRWAPSNNLGQVSDATAPGSCAGALPHPFATDPGVASLPRPDSRAGTASAASSRQASPSARGHSGAFPCTSQSLSTAADQGRQSYGSGSGSPAGSSVLEAETEGERKYRMAKQRLLSAHDLSPQEWARIGPPQDAADLEKFTARSYSVSVDFDRQTLMPQRVAKPDIFHISADEAHRRQIEADEATLALQAQRRAEMEAEEQAAEAERLARTARRGPRYDALGVRQVDRSPSPVLPRFLDWHPPSVDELQQQAAAAAAVAAAAAGRLPLSTTRRSLSGGSGAGVGASASASPHGSRCASAARARPETAASAGAYGRQTDALPGADPYVYEDLGDDAAEGELGVGAAYGTHPPRRRHHSARAGSFVPTPRPPGVSDAHYAQMVRQQRKWLNAPAQPPRPVSAAPFPAPMSLQYVRPRSSRPPPEGTAAPIPSRVAAAAAALAAASDPANRLNSSLRTVIHQRNPQQLPPRPNSRGGVGGGSSHSRANWGPAPTSSRPASANAAANAAAAASFVAALPGGGGGVNSWAAASQQAVRQTNGGSAAVAAAQPSSSRPASATGAADPAAGAGQLTHTPLRGGKRLPWEFREHVAAAAAVGIIPPRLSWDDVDVTPAAASGGGGAAAAAGSVRRSSNGTSGVSGSARSRGGSAPPRRQQQQQQQQQQARQAVVVGETLPPEGASKAGGEQYLPRKFELREGLVLDGFMGRL